MSLVVYTVYGGQPDYRGADHKYSAKKENSATGALIVKDLQFEDTGVYFCAVSKHSDVRCRVAEQKLIGEQIRNQTFKYFQKVELELQKYSTHNLWDTKCTEVGKG